MEKEGLSEQDAFARLRKASQISGRPLKVVAEALIATLEPLEGRESTDAERDQARGRSGTRGSGPAPVGFRRVIVPRIIEKPPRREHADHESTQPTR